YGRPTLGGGGNTRYMSPQGRSTLPEQALLMERLLNPSPNPGTGVVHGQQQLGLGGNIPQVLHQFGAGRACAQVLLFFRVPAAFDDIGQDLLEFLTVHVVVHPLPTNSLSRWWLYLRAAFSALLSFNSSRSFMRALCNCDLLLAMEQPIISAISLCSYPSTSCNTKMMRYPGGRLSMARSRLTRSMEPARTLSRARMSLRGPSSCCGSRASSSDTSGNPFLRRCISTTLTDKRCSQVENADSPRKVEILR